MARVKQLCIGPHRRKGWHLIKYIQALRPERVWTPLTEGLSAVLHCGGGGVLAVEHEYAHQKTLGYGADWCHDVDLPVVATASFYDRALHIWKPPSSGSLQ